jgi:hypothetical protein
MKTLLTIALVALLAAPLFAQDGGEDEKFDLEAALRRVSELLEKAEVSLIDSLKPGTDAATAKKDVAEAKRAMEEFLDDSQKTGKEAIDLMNEILEKAPRGGGGGSGQQEEDKEKSEKEKRDAQKNRKTDQLDPGNSADRPENARKNPTQPEKGKRKPPESETDDPSKPDPNREWLAGLPAVLRDRFQNMEWEKIPRQWQEVIEAYRKRLAEIDSERDGD